MNDDVIVVIIASAFGVMFSMVLVWFVIVSKYFSYIRDNHPVLYQELGEPRLFASNDAASDISFVRYVFSKKYMESGDETLIAKSLLIKKLVYIYSAIFILIVAGLIGSGAS